MYPFSLGKAKATFLVGQCEKDITVKHVLKKESLCEAFLVLSCLVSAISSTALVFHIIAVSLLK